MYYPISIEKQQNIFYILCNKHDHALKHYNKRDVRSLSNNLERISPHYKPTILPIKISQYKVARSGSTLLNSLLECDDRIKIVSEPSIINRICDDSEISESNKISLLNQILNLLAVQLDNKQRVCFIDFNSNTLANIKLVEKAIQQPHQSVFLTREPLITSQSLLKGPPGWLDSSNIYKSISDYLKNQARIVLDNKLDNVFYYESILNFEYPKWIYKILGLDLDNNLKEVMKLKFNKHSKDSNLSFKPGKDYSIRTVPEELKTLLEYDPILVDFRVKYPPYYHYQTDMKFIDEYDIDTDINEIYRIIQSAERPILIKNASKWFNVDITKIKGRNIVTKKENQFVFIKNTGESSQNQDTFTNWDNQVLSIDEFFNKTNKNEYFIGGDYHNENFHDLARVFPEKGSLYNSSVRATNKGAVSPLHLDSNESFLYQAKGEKTMYFCDPKEIDLNKIYPNSHLLSRRFIMSFEYPNYELFPDFDIRRFKIANLKEGDLVYFPSPWPHYTVSKTASISFGLRYTSTSELLKSIIPLNDDEMSYYENKLYPNYDIGIANKEILLNSDDISNDDNNKYKDTDNYEVSANLPIVDDTNHTTSIFLTSTGFGQKNRRIYKNRYY